MDKPLIMAIGVRIVVGMYLHYYTYLIGVQLSFTFSLQTIAKGLRTQETLTNTLRR